ncbi:sigma-54 interaction domain-containing protein [Lutispora saccharofermentans]|uniref:Sigma 54-interacting transcriptional regulator n=1 Tax=Lutispora saccharofermentans TaxID=3024236 RepID=A0ABT1NEU5_9FIRM|nr:sigma 54-interacting transcriptional regulator [Lutispora saccharofermentans]MCQ1529760.1 sigma 54-interacting transcriptional regulator [Lutispora saccharofermentans]
MALNMLYKSILETIIGNIDAGIHVVNSEGKTIFYNKIMGELEGLDIDEVMGKNILEIFPSLCEDTSTVLTVMKSKRPIYNKSQSYLNNYGKQINTINSTIPFKISPEKYGAVEIAKDITQVKELSEKVQILQQVLARKDPEKENIKGYTFKSIIGEDDDFLNTISFAKTASKSSSTVLIYGETGTGKELFAQSIHYDSARSNKPFIAQNCAALPESLLEGILFGTVKGSYTGAINRPGLFEQAHGGTLLLDEINSMGLQLQAKLLRVLQEGYIRRVGGLNDIPCDVRIIATTNEEPEKAVASGALRRDLYYRLNVIYLRIPPLRERKMDIPLLSEHFIKKFNTVLKKDVWDISNEVKNAFLHYDWPGNVRELENLIESAMNMVTKDHIIKAHHFSNNMKPLFEGGKTGVNYKLLSNDGKSLVETLEIIEKELINNALKECSYNITKSAKKLGIKRQNLQHKIKRYNISIE